MLSPRTMLFYGATTPALPQKKSSCTIFESFPAPNAWIQGGYLPWYTRLGKIVDHFAPP